MCIRDRPYGTLIATYQYDPWGNPRGIKDASGKAIAQTGNHIATYNPFRYRGYRYDVDTGLYYLQSRYYDPMTCRFVNADRYASTGQGPIGNNMFSYCNNSPVRYDDQTGAMISGPGYMCVNDGGHAGPSEIGEDDDTSVIACLLYTSGDGEWDQPKERLPELSEQQRGRRGLGAVERDLYPASQRDIHSGDL